MAETLPTGEAMGSNEARTQILEKRLKDAEEGYQRILAKGAGFEAQAETAKALVEEAKMALSGESKEEESAEMVH